MSVTVGGPSRLPDFTVTVLPTRETSTRPRRPCSAWTLMRFWFHPRTMMAPPKLLTDKLEPAGTANVVSVWACKASEATAMAASVISIPIPLGLCHERVDASKQLYLASHGICEVEIQVRVSGIVLQRDARLCDRPIDNSQILPH